MATDEQKELLRNKLQQVRRGGADGTLSVARQKLESIRETGGKVDTAGLDKSKLSKLRGFGVGLAKGVGETLRQSVFARRPGITGLTKPLVTEEAVEAVTPEEKAGKITETAAEFVIGGGLIRAGVKAGVKALRATKTSLAKRKEDIIKFISPTPTPTKATEAIKTKGRISALGKVELDFSKDPQIIKGAEVLDKVIDTKKTFTENIINVNKTIADISENRIAPFLSENPIPFNFGDLRKSFELITPKSGLKADPSAFKTYNRVREDILSNVESFLRKRSGPERITDFNDVWDARKVVDNIISDELGTKVLGTPEFTGVKAAAQDIRAAFSDFILDSFKFPGQVEEINRIGDIIKVSRSRGIKIDTEEDILNLLKQRGIVVKDENIAKAAFFKENMDQLNAMFNAIDNMAPSARKEIGTNALNRFLKTPFGKAVKITAGGALAGSGFTAALSLTE